MEEDYLIAQAKFQEIKEAYLLIVEAYNAGELDTDQKLKLFKFENYIKEQHERTNIL